MQRIPKKTTTQNKWDGSRRIQTEANDTDEQFDINSLMKKYKRNFAQDYQYANSSNTLNKKNFNNNNNTNNNGPRKSNGQSIDNNNKFRKSTTGANNNITNASGANRNVLTRNLNYNKSVIQNNSNGNNENKLSSEYYKQSTLYNKSQSFVNSTSYGNSQQQQQNSSQQYSSQLHQSSQQQPNKSQQLSTKNQPNRLSSQMQQQMPDPSQRIQTEPAQSSGSMMQQLTSSQMMAQQKQKQLDPSQYTYNNEKVVGSGTFGVVYKARIKETGQVVAIKKVLQDKRYKNRELQILKELNHPNVLKMIHAYFSQGENPDENYLHVVMQYIPETVYSMNRHYIKQRQYMPSILVKLYAYQIMRSLVYIHTEGICHRDIKPHNILVDPASNRVVLCDFGSAKKLINGEPNISYICSRCYRAPELIFGAVEYTNQIDMWSCGCVIAEIINGEPLFIGESAVDQLVEIIKVLGTPSKEQVLQMNQQYDLKDYKFPQIKQREWKKVLRSKTDPLCIDFISKILVYSPVERLNPLQAIAHPYFDELRDEKKLKTLSTKIRIPNLFDFTQTELSMQPDLTHKVIPDWYFEKYGIKSHH